MKSRRQFIQRCSSALLGAVALPSIGRAASASRSVNFTAFSRQVNSSFNMVGADGRSLAVVLEMAQPSVPAKRPELADHRNFRLKFASQETQALPQGLYSFQHPVLGGLDIFVVPNHATATGLVNYSATFHGASVAA